MVPTRLPHLFPENLGRADVLDVTWATMLTRHREGRCPQQSRLQDGGKLLAFLLTQNFHGDQNGTSQGEMFGSLGLSFPLCTMGMPVPYLDTLHL